MIVFLFFFFFQAEDGIRDLYVTGVQTCALPICDRLAARRGVDDLLQTLVDHVAVALEGEDAAVGKHAFHARRHRWSATVQGLHEVDVDRAREARVAADPGHRDRAVGDAQLLDRLQQDPQREGVTGPGGQVVVLSEQQVGLEVTDLARRRGRCRIGGDERHARAPSGNDDSAASIRPRMTSTSSRSPTPKPEPSVEIPPMNCTGARPSTPRRTSSTIWPLFSSNTMTPRTPSDAAATAS